MRERPRHWPRPGMMMECEPGCALHGVVHTRCQVPEAATVRTEKEPSAFVRVDARHEGGCNGCDYPLLMDTLTGEREPGMVWKFRIGYFSLRLCDRCRAILISKASAVRP